MPLKNGELNASELRRLIKKHNQLMSIKIPPKTNRDGLIKLIESNGYKINHAGQKLEPSVQMKRKPIVNLPPAPAKKTAEEKEEAKKKKKSKAEKQEEEAFESRKKKIEAIQKLRKKKTEPKKEEPKKSEPKEEIDKLKGYNKLLKKFNDLYKERLEIQDDYLKGKMTLDEYEDEFVDLGNSILKVFLNNDNNGLDNNLSKDTPSGKILNNGVEKFLESKSEIFKKWKSRTNDKPNKSEQKKSEPKKKDDGVKKYELTFKEQNNILSVIRRIEKGNFNYRKGMGKILNNKILFQSDKKNNLKDLFMSKVKGVRIMFYKRQLSPKLKKIYNIEEPIPKEDEEFNKWFNNAIKND